MNLHDVGRQPLGATWDNRDLITAGGDHNLVSEVKAVGRIKRKAMLRVATQLSYRHAFEQRRIEGGNEAVHVGDNFIAYHEAVGVRPLIGKAGQLALPVWGDETKCVPSFSAPGVPARSFSNTTCSM